MAQNKELKRLPSMEHRFDIQIEGGQSGVNWIGSFTYRRPSIGTKSQIEVLTAQFNGDLVTLDSATKEINYALAHLRFSLIEFPDWWEDSTYGMNLYDYNVVLDIYSKCMEFEKIWSEKINERNKKPDASIESGTTDSEKTTKTSVSYKRDE